MKLVNNLLGACAIAITAEGMTIGIKAGLDPARMIEVLNVSSRPQQRHAGQMAALRSCREPLILDLPSGLCLKDVRLCLAAARIARCAVGRRRGRGELLERTVAQLGADSDFTAMAKIVESRRRAGPGAIPYHPFLGEDIMKSELFDKGMKIRTEVLGEAYVKKAMAGMDEFNRPLQELVTEYCWGAVWGREGLKRSERSMINLAMISS